MMSVRMPLGKGMNATVATDSFHSIVSLKRFRMISASWATTGNGDKHDKGGSSKEVEGIPTNISPTDPCLHRRRRLFPRTASC